MSVLLLPANDLKEKNEFVFKDTIITNKLARIRAFMRDTLRGRSVVQLRGSKPSRLAREIS